MMLFVCLEIQIQMKKNLIVLLPSESSPTPQPTSKTLNPFLIYNWSKTLCLYETIEGFECNFKRYSINFSAWESGACQRWYAYSKVFSFDSDDILFDTDRGSLTKNFFFFETVPIFSCNFFFLKVRKTRWSRSVLKWIWLQFELRKKSLLRFKLIFFFLRIFFFFFEPCVFSFILIKSENDVEENQKLCHLIQFNLIYTWPSRYSKTTINRVNYP